MEEPLQPRAPQLWAGSLREQSGEAAAPASLGPRAEPPAPPGPSRVFFPFSSDTRLPRLSSSRVVITPLAPLLNPGHQTPTLTLPPASPLCRHQGQSGTSAPSPTRSHLPGSKFHPSRHPALWLPDNQLASSYPPLQTSLRSLQSSAFPGPSPRPPPPGPPAAQLLAGPTLVLKQPFPARLPLDGGSISFHPLAPPCPAMAGCVLQRVLIFAVSPWRRSPTPLRRRPNFFYQTFLQSS